MNQFKILTGHLWLSPDRTEKKGWNVSECKSPGSIQNILYGHTIEADKLYVFVLFVVFTSLGQWSTGKKVTSFSSSAFIARSQQRTRKGIFREKFLIIWNWMPPERTRPIVYMSVCAHNRLSVEHMQSNPFSVYLMRLMFHHNSLQFYTLKMPLSPVSISMFVYALLNNLGCIIWRMLKKEAAICMNNIILLLVLGDRF